MIRVISASELTPIAPDRDYWDMWPLTYENGAIAILGGRSWWFFLAAARAADPEDRHDRARIHLVSRSEMGWKDHGGVLPADLSPGSREWSGSAVLGSDRKTVTLYFTAAGRREGGPRFEQRLFAATGTLDASSATTSHWSRPVELVTADGEVYAFAQAAQATDGMIPGFRDPTYFRDPLTGSEYILFTGSSGRSTGPYNGVIGLAELLDSRWVLREPLIDATGFNHELERAHVVWRDGQYYLFWSTHAARFVPGKALPTGLYGMVSERLSGPWRPLNDNSLVACNPPEEPTQAYCWWVTSDLEVVSFANYWGLQGRRLSSDLPLARQTFGGTLAPSFALEIKGDRTRIIYPR